MVHYYSADYILPVTEEPVKNGTIAVDDGLILGIYGEHDPQLKGKDIQKFEGLIVPGFINCHCHLELSGLHGLIEKGTGLINFIKKVVASKKQREKGGITQEAMKDADKRMEENGIVAVGDISNTIDSKTVKEQSSLYYHTFIELLGFDPDKAKDVFRAGTELFNAFKPLKASIVPHAPYSVSRELFRYMNKFCWETGSILSIHNQESEEENKLFRYKKGEFIDFYKSLNVNIDFFKAQARNSVQSFIPLMPEKQKLLLVHNTYTSTKDLYFIKRSEREVSFCFCPNANLYIENKLPKIDKFLLDDFNITLGTDSLASNDKLCILSELKTIHSAFPSLQLKDTIRWATLNGAKFLDIADEYGSLDTGKKPGINLINNTKGMELTDHSTVKKLA